MNAFFTKKCTDVYMNRLSADHIPEYRERKGKLITHFQQRYFRSQDRFSSEYVRTALQEMQRQLLAEQHISEVKAVCSKQARTVLSRKDRVNLKRELINKVIENRATRNIAEIAKASKSHRSTVKSVMRELDRCGEVSKYEYNNLKSEAELEALNRTIEEESEGFLTVSQVKRKHPQFSRKRILKTLHEKNLRYRLMPKNRQNPVVRIVDSTNVCNVISHIAQAMADPNTTLLYCDEMHLALNQTAVKRWVDKDADQREELHYNRRPALDYTLNVIAMCSVHRFEAVQVFERAVNANDFLNFLTTAISQLDPSRNYTVIVDNAGWHHANIVSRAAVSKFMFFNEPYLFQLNIIENAFSFVRHYFRHRPIVETLAQETKLIVDIFFDEENEARFKGLLRNHLKVLLEFLEKHRD